MSDIVERPNNNQIEGSCASPTLPDAITSTRLVGSCREMREAQGAALALVSRPPVILSRTASATPRCAR